MLLTQRSHASSTTLTFQVAKLISSLNCLWMYSTFVVCVKLIAYRRYFQQYSHFLPILDPQTTPNAYYTQSPFLFWAIIGVGCRTYAENPTLLTALAAGIIDKALLSVGSTLIPWQTIQGLLLLLTWPFPKDPSRPDLTFILSGLLLHIAMQHGLHIPMSSHEFSKIELPTPSETDMVRRSELWAHCVITYQR